MKPQGKPAWIGQTGLGELNHTFPSAEAEREGGLKMSGFTSGRTDGFCLNKEKYNFPDRSNLYGDIGKGYSTLEIVTKFYEIGWSVRRSSWEDFEIEAEWAKFAIIEAPGIFINGIIDTSQFDTLAKILTDFDVQYHIRII